MCVHTPFLSLTHTGIAAVSDAEVEELYREVNKFALAAHFYWGVWFVRDCVWHAVLCFSQGVYVLAT